MGVRNELILLSVDEESWAGYVLNQVDITEAVIHSILQDAARLLPNDIPN